MHFCNRDLQNNVVYIQNRGFTETNVNGQYSKAGWNANYNGKDLEVDAFVKDNKGTDDTYHIHLPREKLQNILNNSMQSISRRSNRSGPVISRSRRSVPMISRSRRSVPMISRSRRSFSRNPPLKSETRRKSNISLPITKYVPSMPSSSFQNTIY